MSWIKINSEKDLPKDGCQCWIFAKKKIQAYVVVYDPEIKAFVNLYGQVGYGLVDSYKVIEKPELPKKENENIKGLINCIADFNGMLLHGLKPDKYNETQYYITELKKEFNTKKNTDSEGN